MLERNKKAYTTFETLGVGTIFFFFERGLTMAEFIQKYCKNRNIVK